MLTTFLLLLPACLTAGKYLGPLPWDNNDVLWTALHRPDAKYDTDGVYDTVKHDNDIENIVEKRKIIERIHQKRHHKKKDVVQVSGGRAIRKMKNNHGNPIHSYDIRMPHVSPKKVDTYFCVGFKLPKGDRYIVKYEPAAKMQIAHHMLMYGCETPFQAKGHWSCREMKPVCAGGSQAIVYAWGKNAPPLEMPQDVGVHVGGKSGLNYLVLQVHYLNVSSFKGGKTDNSGVTVTLDRRKKDRLAGIYLLAAGWPPIKPHLKKSHMDMGCLYPKGEGNPTFTAFRFRVHAHKLGRVITAYRVRHNIWTLIGHGDPQIPQAFYRTEHEIKVRPGDTLMGRCTFNSESRNETTYVGVMHTDEMCNCYIMYHYDPKTHGEHSYLPCEAAKPKYYYEYPIDSDEPRNKTI